MENRRGKRRKNDKERKKGESSGDTREKENRKIRNVRVEKRKGENTEMQKRKRTIKAINKDKRKGLNERKNE